MSDNKYRHALCRQIKCAANRLHLEALAVTILASIIVQGYNAAHQCMIKRWSAV